MNIDTAQERDGGRVSSLAQQQPEKLKRGRGGETVRWKDFKISAECVVTAKQAVRSHLETLKVFQIACLSIFNI